ncbi:hypothetical protein L204_101469 [Cryptococcus depauperatus]
MTSVSFVAPPSPRTPKRNVFPKVRLPPTPIPPAQPDTLASTPDSPISFRSYGAPGEIQDIENLESQPLLQYRIERANVLCRIFGTMLVILLLAIVFLGGWRLGRGEGGAESRRKSVAHWLYKSAWELKARMAYRILWICSSWLLISILRKSASMYIKM